MSRRFQFSLRALFAGMALLCVFLGARYLYWNHFASYIVAETRTASEIIRLRGQFFLPHAADSTVYWITIRGHPPRPGGVLRAKGRVERSGYGMYRFSIEPDARWTSGKARWGLPGRYDLILEPLGGESVSGLATISLRT